MFRLFWIAICCGATWLAYLMTQSLYVNTSDWFAAKKWLQAPASITALELKVSTSTSTDSNGRRSESKNCQQFQTSN